MTSFVLNVTLGAAINNKTWTQGPGPVLGPGPKISPKVPNNQDQGLKC
jgi:hypothetical protein